MNPPDAFTSVAPSPSPAATQPPPQRRPSLAILHKAASVKRRSQLDVSSNPSQHQQRPSTPLQPSLSHSQTAPATEEVHTYTLCLLGYLQTFSSSTRGSIKEIPLQLDSAIRHVSCGLDWLCILTENGRVYSFGSNTYGQLAQGHLQSISYPKPICFALEKRIARVSCGTCHGGFLLDSGALFMFGCGSYGRLGTGNEQSQSTPVAVKMRWSLLQTKAAELSGELVHSILGGGGGGGGGGATGSMRMAVAGDPGESHAVPSDTTSDDEVTFTDISCGDRHTLLLGAKTLVLHGKKMAKTHLIAYGDGTNGRLGIGSESDHHSGVLLTQFRASIASYVPSFASIHAGAAHNAAVTTAGEVFTWGNGADGQLGHDGHESEWLPREVQFFRGISMAAAKCGAKHTVAISRTGVVYTWGRGLEGQLGSGGITSSSIPQRATLVVDPLALQQAQIDAQLAAGSSSSSAFSSSSSLLVVQDTRVLVRSIVARENVTLAMDEQSRVFVWGDNSASQLGLQPGLPFLESSSSTDTTATAVSAKLGSFSSSSSSRVVTPRQLLYQNLKEPKKLASRVRDRVLAATASTSLPRVALVQIEASDRFSVLVFRTKAPANAFGHGDGDSSGNVPSPSSSVGSVAARLARHRSSYMNDMDGSTVKWHFGLADPLPVSDIPSREAAYYKYMVQYKVHIRVAKGDHDVDDNDGDNDDAGSRRRKSSQAGMAAAAPLHNARRRNSVLSIPPDMRAQLKPQHPESDDESDDSDDVDDDWEQQRRAMLRSLHSPRSAAEAVKGFDAWLARRHRNPGDTDQLSPVAARCSPQRNGSDPRPLYHFGTAPRFPSLSSPPAGDTKQEEPRQSTGCRARSATPAARAAPGKPCPPKSAFGRRAVTKLSPRGASASSSSSSRRPATATATGNQSPLPTKPPASPPATAAPLVSPSSASQPPSRDTRRRLFNQFVAPFGSSVTCRFGPKSPRANDANQLIIYPEKCDSMAFPRSPRPHLGDSAEQFSQTIARRLQHAKGATPGPGTYDRNRG